MEARIALFAFAALVLAACTPEGVQQLSESDVIARCTEAIRADQGTSPDLTFAGERTATKVVDGWDVFIDFKAKRVTGATSRMKGLCFVESQGERVSVSFAELP